MTHRGAAPRGVLVVGPLPPPVHGAARVTEGVLDEVRRRAPGVGVTVEAVSTAGDAAASGLRYHCSRVEAHARALSRLAALRGRGPTRLYLGGAGGAGLWYQLVLAGAAGLLGVPVVFHHHSYGVLDSAYPVMRGLVAVLGRQGTHVCLSVGMARVLRDVYAPRGAVLATSNARFVPNHAPERAPAGERLRLVHVSNLSVDKGSVRVVETFRRLRHRGVDARLVLVGATTDERVEDVVDGARREFPGIIEHHGQASRDEVFAALDDADLFVFPTSYSHEAQPLVVLEALARGLPVLASDRGALGELLPREWLIDEAEHLEDQILRLVAGDRRGLTEVAREAFIASRRGGDDVVAALLGAVPSESAGT